MGRGYEESLPSTSEYGKTVNLFETHAACSSLSISDVTFFHRSWHRGPDDVRRLRSTSIASPRSPSLRCGGHSGQQRTLIVMDTPNERTNRTSKTYKVYLGFWDLGV